MGAQAGRLAGRISIPSACAIASIRASMSASSCMPIALAFLRNFSKDHGQGSTVAGLHTVAVSMPEEPRRA